MKLPTICPVCKSKNNQKCKNTVRYAEDVDVVRCLSCSLIYLWPQPDDERLTEFYTHDYRTLYEDPTPAERHNLDTAEALQRIERLQPYLMNNTRLLEVGGACAFLHNVSSMVSEVVGVEMDEATRKWFSSVSPILVYEKLECVPKDDNFDLIVLFHLLEHMADPVGFLKKLAGRLNKGGRIIVEVPNVEDALLSLYNIEEFKEFYYSIAHLTYFSSKSLAKCAKKASLHSNISYIQRYDISNHLFWALNNRSGGQGSFTGVVSNDTNMSYVNDLVTSGKTDTLWAEIYPHT